MITAFHLHRGSADVQAWAPPGNVIVIGGVLRGVADDEWLMRAIVRIHETAAEEGLREVVVDLRALSHANASCWKCFVNWCRLLREVPDGYVLKLRISRVYTWQTVGTSALRVFGDERITVEAA